MNIAVEKSFRGATTDINGQFSILLPDIACDISISHVGYEKISLACESLLGQEGLIISLKEKTTALQEVVITPGITRENPAFRIVRAAIKSKPQHDPYLRSSFRYNSYNKLFYTLKGIDTAAIPVVSDSSSEKVLLKNSHFFMSESYTERKFLAPNHSKEVVLANRMAGYKNPMIAMVATDFQPISFYEDFINFFDKQYLNPISRGSTRKYTFVLEDTVLHERDSTFVISFEPAPGKNFDGLKGVISINSDGYAIENVIAAPADQALMIGFKIQQKYERIAGEWFPVQLNTDAEFTQLKIRGRNVLFSSKSFLTNINLNPDLTKEDFDHISTEIAPRANQQDEQAWQQYRTHSLDLKEQNTYRFDESLGAGKLALLNGYMSFLEGLLLSRFKVGPVDLLADKLYAFNEYEGNRLGVGLQTKETISRFVSIGGYVGYGFQDKALKYGGNMVFKLHAKTETTLLFLYRKDLSEPGALEFFGEHRLRFGQESMRDWITYRMDSVAQLKSVLRFRTSKYLQVQASLSKESRNPAYAYHYTPAGEENNSVRTSFHVVEAGVGLRYAPNERFVQIGRGQLVLKPSSPVFTFYYGRGLDNAALEGDYGFHRLALKADQSFYTRDQRLRQNPVAAFYRYYEGQGTMPLPDYRQWQPFFIR